MMLQILMHTIDLNYANRLIQVGFFFSLSVCEIILWWVLNVHIKFRPQIFHHEVRAHILPPTYQFYLPLSCTTPLYSCFVAL